MSAAPDSMPSGAPFEIGEKVVAALQSAPELAGALVLNNPLRAIELAEGTRILFYEDSGDSFIKQPGQVQRREFSFSIGVINRTDAARRGAHTDYRAAKRVVRATLKSLSETLRCGAVQEGSVTYRLENIDVGGGLVLGSFSIDYRDPV